MIRSRLLLLTTLLLSSLAPAQNHSGSETCASCHPVEAARWRQSHHFHAMAPALPGNVLGDFDNATFDYFGNTSRFYRRDGQYYVETADETGQLQEFRIAYTFGWTPLQQYLVEMPDDGRLQALSITWDSRPATEGGQHWYHLYPDEEIRTDDPLHWTGAFQNWNSRCASCHSTALDKAYNPDEDSYATTWSEINVGCEACHGPGSEHVAWAGGDRSTDNKGLLIDISSIWSPREGSLPIPEPVTSGPGAQVQLCAGCHARRGELQARDLTLGFFENYSLSPLLEGLYYSDGQILEEVYVAGSFLQSRMHANQVSCSNCHEPHDGTLVVNGNGLCLQCHQAARFESESHYFHTPGSEGAQCVNCHMPATTYMGVDNRRDHSFRVPDLQASLDHGVPDPCTACHIDQGAQWAAEMISSHSGRMDVVYSHTGLLDGARKGNADIAGKLMAYARDGSHPAVLRGIALIEGARFPGLDFMSSILTALADPDPLLRQQAAAATAGLDSATRLEYLTPLMADPVKSVRMATARQLRGIASDQVPLPSRTAFISLIDEYRESLIFNADMPESMSELGVLNAAQNDLVGAEQALLSARQLSPGYLPALLNLADVYRERGRDDMGESVLNDALGRYPDSAEVNHALGLLYVRTRRTPNAVFLFQRATRLAPDNPQFALVFSLSLIETGRPEQAVTALQDALVRFPDHPGLASTLQALQRQ